MPRQLDPEEAFAGRLEELVPTKDGREVVLRGIELTIAVQPEMGFPVDPENPVQRYFFVPEAEGWNVPRMFVLYTFDDDFIYLNWVGLPEEQPGLTQP